MTAVVAKRRTTVRKFRTVQKRRKLHYTIYGHTAAELIQQRADGNKKNMDWQEHKGSPKDEKNEKIPRLLDGRTI
ncbi:MAG: virulence RhuM family protein [Gemmatimonadota bacterium]|nr:virulence RhuM family protein [Gemmatimonadota bacterium]